MPESVLAYAECSSLQESFEVQKEIIEAYRKISSANPEGLPLGASASSKVFKALMADVFEYI